LKIGLQPKREDLYKRIHNRLDAMLQAGWLEEVSRLLSSNLPENAKPFNFIGYRELRSHLRGEITLDAAREAIQQGTRQYAKRQLTWFRREANAKWLPGFGDDPAVQANARDWLTAEYVSNTADGAPIAHSE
jgi:tRNA dimethylallyltransferase